MNEELRYDLPEKVSPNTNEDPERVSPSETELFGAMDIVEAFTALRHELKLQVRGGRELQQSLATSVERLEQQLATRQPVASATIPADEFRRLAEAVAEMEESLQRAADMLTQQADQTNADDEWLNRWESSIVNSSWLTRTIAGGLLSELRDVVKQAFDDRFKREQSLVEVTRQGVVLLLARVHRLMEQCDLERVDVEGEPFDADVMQAVDVVESPNVDSAHVAEQLSPAYRWRGRMLRCAHVRVAR